MIEPNADGTVTCIQCGVDFKPALVRPPGDDRPLQLIYPNARPIEREQLISGIGCDACWDLFLTGQTDKACTCEPAD